MEKRVPYYEGCLLGMAIGDALGFAVDGMDLEQIRVAYGPNGLMGYDTAGEFAEISTHTQTAAAAANGLLVALDRGRTDSASVYILRALREWSRSRSGRSVQDDTMCWVNRLPVFCRRNATDVRVLDALNRERVGTPNAPANRTDAPAALMAPVAVGLFYHDRRMVPSCIGTLGAETAALLCGAQEAFLAGAAVAYMIAAALQAPELTLREHCLQTVAIIRGQFGKQFCQAETVASAIMEALQMSKRPGLQPGDVLESMHCTTACGCLAGAVYTSLVHAENFDAAMVTAVNHSGASAATAAITGAILGARLGADAIPDFYLESLESGPYLRQLARDLATGNPAAGLFNDAWEQKYAQGIPVEV